MTPAIYHASSSVLVALDRIQNRFLASVHVSEVDAFLNFNLAPLGLRRDIAMLGLLHKCALGLAHPLLLDLFPGAPAPSSRHSSRLAAQRHSRQLLNHCDGSHTDYMSRSCLGLVGVYNKLPQSIVDASNVKTFQHKLTALAKQRCEAHGVWTRMFSPREA
jgi:hypothetical protein